MLLQPIGQSVLLQLSHSWQNGVFPTRVAYQPHKPLSRCTTIQNDMWLASLSSNSSIGGRSPASKMISVTLSPQIKPMALHLLVPARVYPLIFLMPPSFFSWSSLPLVQSILWSLLLQIQGSALDMFHVCANVCTVTINVSSSLWMDLRFFTKSYVCVCQGLALDKEEHNYIHRLIYCESQKVGKVQLYHDSAAMKTAWNLLDSLQSDRR